MKEWETEPNELTFVYKGFKCWIKRNTHLGHLCGYVFVPKSNSVFGKEYNQINLYCHGGLTFSQLHDDKWRIGFDCAHYGDLSPYLDKRLSIDEEYRNMDYVKNELYYVVDQLIATQEGIDGLILPSGHFE